MRITLITSKLVFEPDGTPIGGSVADLHLKAKGLLDLGHEITVVTAFSGANKIPCTLPYAVLERYIASRGLIGLQRGIVPMLREFESKADILYIEGHMFLYGGGAYRRLGGKTPVVGFFNIRLNAWGDTSGNRTRLSLYRRAKKRLRLFLEKTAGVPLANHMDAFLFNTPQVQKLYHDFGIGRDKPNAVVPDFVATLSLMKRFDITQRSLRTRKSAGGELTLFATGRMLPEKGFDLLLHAFALLTKKEEYRLVISGDGPDKKRLETLTSERGLSDRVSFPGWLSKEELYAALLKTDIFIFPKWWIEYGSALLPEALALGLPSLIPGGGALEWLSGGAAFTFGNGDAHSLAQRISELGADAKRRSTLASAALFRAEALDAGILARELEGLLRTAARRSLS